VDWMTLTVVSKELGSKDGDRLHAEFKSLAEVMAMQKPALSVFCRTGTVLLRHFIVSTVSFPKSHTNNVTTVSTSRFISRFERLFGLSDI
jgi:hypothetical protein